MLKDFNVAGLLLSELFPLNADACIIKYPTLLSSFRDISARLQGLHAALWWFFSAKQLLGGETCIGYSSSVV